MGHRISVDESMSDTNPMKQIYIAGPMTGYPGLNFPAFHAEATRLRGLGYSVVSPAEIVTDQSVDWIECMLADIPQLIQCDGLVLLPGWEGSKGARIERCIAQSLGKLVLESAATVYAEGCKCPTCQEGTLHCADCGVHNEPSYPNGACTCGTAPKVTFMPADDTEGGAL
jgi:hypothetical protein